MHLFHSRLAYASANCQSLCILAVPVFIRWLWSGGFSLTSREDYFGLRVRHSSDSERALNIPVNITVGPSGAGTAPGSFYTPTLAQYGTVHLYL